jgi:hypothetical protein
MTEHKTNGVAGPAVHAPLAERPARPPHYVAPPAPPLPPPKPQPPAAPVVRVRAMPRAPTQRFAVTVDGGRQFVIYAEDEAEVRRKLDANMAVEIAQGLGITTLGAIRGSETIQLDNVQTDKVLRDNRERQLKAVVVLCDLRDASGAECCDTPASHEHPSLTPDHAPNGATPRCFEHKCDKCVPIKRK